MHYERSVTNFQVFIYDFLAYFSAGRPGEPETRAHARRAAAEPESPGVTGTVAAPASKAAAAPSQGGSSARDSDSDRDSHRDS